MRYRAQLRGFDLSKLEFIVKYSNERYFDTETRRSVIVGRHDDLLVLIPIESDENVITPVTVHIITRQQINFRLNMERLIYE